MKKITVNLFTIAIITVAIAGLAYAYFASSVKSAGNVISTGGAPDILEISDDNTNWSNEIAGFSGIDIFPGYEEFDDIYLRNISTDTNAEIIAYTKESCYDYEDGPCAGVCSGGSSEECNECQQKCYDLFDHGIKMKIVEVTSGGEEDLTEGYHYLKEYRNNEYGSGEWCNEYNEQGGYCASYGNPPMIKNLGFGNNVHLKAYFQLPETNEDQTSLSSGITKFDIEFNGKEVASN